MPSPIDLLTALPGAERRAVGDVAMDVRADWIAVDGDRRHVLLMRAPARVTWDLRLPARARLKAAVSSIPNDEQAPHGVVARVGIAGGRVYETLLRLPLPAGEPGGQSWTSIDVDLSAYSGWQWSLFYRPSAETWRLIFSADATPGGSIAWAQPQIDFGRSP